MIPSFTCPRCGAVSYNARDIYEGYCGRCHDWTREGMTPTQQEFIDKLNPLLLASEEAINANDTAESTRLSYEMLELVKQYSGRMPTHELREALNNPTANAIAARLGVLPPSQQGKLT